VPDALDVVAASVRTLPALRGKGRLAQLLFDRGPRSGSWDVPMHGGYRMVVPRASRQGWAAAFTGRYDEDKFRLALDHVVPETTVLDVGASLGFWTLMLARRTRAGHVVAYEPLPHNLEVLEANLLRNAMAHRVTVEPWGLGDRDAQLDVATEKGGVGNAAVVTEGASDHGDLPDRVTIRVRTLDSMPPVPSRCSFVKIDIEGYELHALAGAQRFLDEHRPVILGEFSTLWSEERGLPADGAEAWATEHGYDVFELHSTRARWSATQRSEPRGLGPGQRRSGGDLLLVPKH
jgi:FkbM family methyltransferase